MGLFIALLRAVNVGGTGKVAMADLKRMAAELGLKSPQTLLQSGNLVFETDGGEPEALEAMLEQRAQAQLGLRTEFLLRTPQAWRELIAANPFPAEAAADPSHLMVFFMKTAPAPEPLEAAADGLPETVRVRGREAYVVYPEGMGRSKLKLPARGTGRNWNTVLKLAAMAGV